ncbi:MAG: alpha/beta hydrolase family protein [Faecalibacillus sp.]
MHNYIKKSYLLHLKDRNIYGVFVLPKTSHQFPIVIFCHGFNGTYQDNMNYAMNFVQMGIGSFLFDFCGGSINSLSSKKTTEMSVFTELDDLSAVIQNIKELSFINQDQMFLFGESQGGLVSALYASQVNNNIAGLILLYPAFNIPDNAKNEYQSIDHIPHQFGLWGVPLGSCYYKDIYNLDVFSSIRDYCGPVLIFHGSHDEIVPVSYSQKANQIYHHSHLRIIKYNGHGIYGPLTKELSDDMIQFINNC